MLIDQVLLTKIEENDPSLVSLNLHYPQIDSEGASVLAKALERNNTITSLDLSGNQFGDDQVAIDISKAMSVNSSVTKLNLANNDIYLEGAIAISKAIERNQTIRFLNLFGCQFSDEEANIFAKLLSVNTSLVKFNLGGNEFSDEGIIAMVLALATNGTLRKLNIEGSELSDEGAFAFAKILTVNTTLTKFRIAGKRLSLAGLNTIAKAMEDNSTLIKLNLNERQNNIYESCIINKIKMCLDKNYQAMLLRRQEFITVIVLLASYTGYRNQVTFGVLPKEIKLYILSFLSLHGKAHIDKNIQQIDQCIYFVFTNIAECKMIIKNKENIKIIEKYNGKSTYHFQFFKPVPVVASEQRAKSSNSTICYNYTKAKNRTEIASYQEEQEAKRPRK